MIDHAFVLAGAATGLIVGITGVGGGALMTPILLLVFGIEPSIAIATDLWFAAITKTLGAGVHHSKGNVDWQIARRLWSGSLPVALIVVVLIGFGLQPIKIEWLNYAIGLVVIITAIGLLFAPKLKSLASQKRLNTPHRFKRYQSALTRVAGGVVGLLVALTSVGAGALGSVALLYLYPWRLNSHKLVATDIVHAIPLAIVAGTGYLMAGLVDGNLLAGLLMGSIPAVWVGGLIAGKVKDGWIRLALALVLMVAGVRVLV